jgi:hypothetical protein
VLCMRVVCSLKQLSGFVPPVLANAGGMRELHAC